MSLRQFFATGLLLPALLCGCAAFVQEPRITLKEASLAGLDSSGIDMEFSLGVTNPNSFDLSLLGYTYDLRVQTLPLSSGGKQETIRFPAGVETGVRLPVRLTYGNLVEIIRHTSGLDRIPCQITASLQLRTPLGEMSLPVTKSTQLTVPEQYRPAAYIHLMRDALQGIR